MSSLERRLGTLEEIAERARRDEMRAEVRALVMSWPEFARLSPEELEAATDEALRHLEEIRARKRQGLSEREVVRLEAQRCADAHGLTVDEVLCDAGLDPDAYR
jgi:hypothetical protein